MRTAIIETLLTVLLATSTTSSIAADDIAHAAKVTVLSSNLANGANNVEVGFSATLHTAEHCNLFDAGRFTNTVVKNATALQVDLAAYATLNSAIFISITPAERSAWWRESAPAGIPTSLTSAWVRDFSFLGSST